MSCSTAKFKLKEANYFLEEIKSEEIQLDEDSLTFNLNAFIISANSVIEYVESDFIYVKVRPWIDWKKWIIKDDRNKILQNHEQSKALNNFREYYRKQRDELFKIPLVNYFRHKRNRIAHRRWDGIKMASWTEYPDGRKIINDIRLEQTYPLVKARNNPDYDIDMCTSEIPKEKQIELCTMLCQESGIPVLEEYIVHLQDFIKKFENKDFFN